MRSAKNLDYLAAKTSQKMVEEAKQKNAPKEIENIITKALGILQGQGIYAMFLYLYSQAAAHNPSAYLLRFLWNELQDEEVPIGVKIVSLEKEEKESENEDKNKILFCEPRKFAKLTERHFREKQEAEKEAEQANTCVQQVKEYSKLWTMNQEKFDEIQNLKDLKNLNLQYQAEALEEKQRIQEWKIRASDLDLHNKFTQLPSVREIILANIRDLTSDLDTLLLVRDLYEQTLIYARFHAKAAE